MRKAYFNRDKVLNLNRGTQDIFWTIISNFKLIESVEYYGYFINKNGSVMYLCVAKERFRRSTVIGNKFKARNYLGWFPVEDKYTPDYFIKEIGTEKSMNLRLIPKDLLVFNNASFKDMLKNM